MIISRWVKSSIAVAYKRLIMIVVLATLGMVISTPVPSDVAPVDPRADQLMVTDCMLPGQVRRLGSRRTYLTPRRPIKTTAADCKIRGGEYVEFDRANYATALQVWLPLAKQGDAEAQNYVGEIFEKGLGTVSDYDAAAIWYRRAAEQGFSRAQINLGQLFERGLGVPQGMREALNWYRRASGLDDDLEYASSISVTLAARDQKIDELEQRSARSERLVADLRQQLETARKELNSHKQKFNNTRSRLEDIRRQLKEQEQLIVDNSGEGLKARHREIDKKEIALEAKRTQLSKFETKLKTQQSTLSLEQRQAAEKNDRLQAQFLQSQAEVNRIRRRIQQVTQELSKTRKKLSADATQDATLIAQLQDVKGERESLQKQLDSREGSIQALEAKLNTTRQELDQAATDYAAAITQLRQRQTLYDVEKNNLQSERDQLAKKSQTSLREIKQLQSDLKRQEREHEERLQKLQTLYADSQLNLKEAEKKLAEVESQSPILVASSSPPPTIELIEPPVTLTRGTYLAKVRGNIEKREIIGKITAPAGIKRFNVNEQPFKLEADGIFSTLIPLQGLRTPVSLTVVDKRGQRVSLDFELYNKQDTGSSGKVGNRDGNKKSVFPRISGLGDYYALIIGNSKYTDFTSLRTPNNDAHAIAKLLEQKYGYRTKLILDANRYKIISALNEYRSKLTKDDNLIVYYAGHGEIDDANNQAYWLPVDAEKNNTANWISTRSISEIVNIMAAKHVMVVADSCYSGAMTRSALARLQAGKTTEEWRKWYQKVAQMRSRMILASGGEEPVNDGGGGKHSIFAQAFLSALTENDRVLDGYNLYVSVSGMVKNGIKRQNLNVDQSPTYAPIQFAGHEAGEFLFQPL